MLRLALLVASFIFASAGTARAPSPDEDQDMASLLQLGVETSPSERRGGSSSAGQVPSQSHVAATERANASLDRPRNGSFEEVPGHMPMKRLEEQLEPRRMAAVPYVNTSASFAQSVATSGLEMGTRLSQERPLRLFRDAGGWIMFLIGVFFPTFGYLLYVWIGWCCARSIGKAISVAIETYDTSILGVDVEIGKLQINPCEGKVVIDGLTVDNPEGYKSDYLLTARSVEVDFDMRSLIVSNFKHVVIETVALKRVDIIYEKTWSSSNVHDVLDFLDGKEKKKDESCLSYFDKDKREEQNAEEAAAEKREEKKNEEKKKEKATHMEIIGVALEDVGMRLQGQMLHGHGVRIALADIKYINFTKEVGASAIDDIIKILLKSVMKTVVANVVGRRTAEWCC